jgi:hypothetical protein
LVPEKRELVGFLQAGGALGAAGLFPSKAELPALAQRCNTVVENCFLSWRHDMEFTTMIDSLLDRITVETGTEFQHGQRIIEIR